MSYTDRIKPTHKGIATYLGDLKNKVYQVPAFCRKFFSLSKIATATFTGNIFCKQKSDSLVFTESFSAYAKIATATFHRNIVWEKQNV